MKKELWALRILFEPILLLFWVEGISFIWMKKPKWLLISLIWKGCLYATEELILLKKDFPEGNSGKRNWKGGLWPVVERRPWMLSFRSWVFICYFVGNLKGVWAGEKCSVVEWDSSGGRETQTGHELQRKYWVKYFRWWHWEWKGILWDVRCYMERNGKICFGGTKGKGINQTLLKAVSLFLRVDVKRGRQYYFLKFCKISIAYKNF